MHLRLGTLVYCLFRSLGKLYYINIAQNGSHYSLTVPGLTRKFLSAEKEADEAVFTETAEERQYWNQWALSKDPTAPNIPRHMIKSVLKSQPKYTVDIWSNNGLGESF